MAPDRQSGEPLSAAREIAPLAAIFASCCVYAGSLIGDLQETVIVVTALETDPLGDAGGNSP